MAEKKSNRRHSKPLDASLIKDPQARAEAEARNGLRQFDLGMEIVETALVQKPSRLRPSMLLALNRTALEGISSFAGNYRPAGISIEGSKHEPPDAHLVPELVEDMCDYVNDHCKAATPIHISSYLMWRLNWIHPFVDGNGRTSRIISYVSLCVMLGYRLPGTQTIPEQIGKNRDPYFNALDKADAAFECGKMDVSVMETLIESLLAHQLTGVFKSAGRVSGHSDE